MYIEVEKKHCYSNPSILGALLGTVVEDWSFSIDYIIPTAAVIIYYASHLFV